MTYRVGCSGSIYRVGIGSTKWVDMSWLLGKFGKFEFGKFGKFEFGTFGKFEFSYFVF